MRTIFLIALLFLVGCTSPEVALQKKYSKASTPELQLKHRQLAEAINNTGFDFRFGNPIALAMMGPSKNDRIREKEEIERELLRRYQAGDKAAYLTLFQ